MWGATAWPPIFLYPELLHGLLGLRFGLRVLAGLVQRIGLLGQLPGVIAGVVETVVRLVVHLLDELRTLERRRRPGDGEEQRESDADHECGTPHRCGSFRSREMRFVANRQARPGPDAPPPEPSKVRALGARDGRRAPARVWRK